MSDGEWITSEIAMLEEMWARGCFAREIGEAVGKSRNAVIGKARRMNLAARQRGFNISTRPRAPRVRAPKEAGPPVHIPPPKEPSGGPVTIMELTWRTCRWPLGLPAHDMLYCGQEIDGASVYCREHHRKSVDKATRSRM